MDYSDIFANFAQRLIDSQLGMLYYKEKTFGIVEGDIVVYFVEGIDKIDIKLINSLVPYVSAERIRKINGYRFITDQIQSLLAFILLRVGLYLECGIDQMPHFCIDENNKPHLVERDDIYFNISHCKKGVACGISDAEVGVDIQDYVKFDSSIAERFMSEEEQCQVKMGESDVEFTRIWTLKESYGKYIGKGICYSMHEHTVYEDIFADNHISKSFLLDSCVISFTAEKRLKIVRLLPDDLLRGCMMIEVEKNENIPVKWGQKR